MKKLALFLVMAVMMAISASAVQITGVTFGGENQDRVANVVATFKIVNNNSATLSGIVLAKEAGAEAAKYDIKFSGVPTTLAANAEATITANATIPLDHAGVDSIDLKEKALKIGVVRVTGTVGATQDTATSDVTMQAVNQLQIKKARVECNTKSQSLDDGDRVENLKPGEQCTLDIEVENNFDDSDRDNKKIGDITMESIDITVDSSESDLDIDDSDDLDDLDAGDKDSLSFDMDIDEEADDGSISVSIRVSSRDENGALHGEPLDFRLEVERLTHDIQIRKIDVSPSVVSACEASNVKITAHILNQGKRNEDEIAVEAKAVDLKFSKKVENVELDKDDSTVLNFDMPVPANTKPGVVRVDVDTFFDLVAPSNTGSFDLTVESCETEPVVTVPKTETTTQPTVTTPKTTVTVPSGSTQAAPKKTSSFTESKAYLALLVVMSILIAAGIATLIAFLMRRKQ